MPDVGRGLKLVKPGDRLEIAHDGDQVLSLRRELDDVPRAHDRSQRAKFEASTFERQIELRPIGAHGVVRSSLFEAGVQAGVSDKLVMDLAGIFEWDIDFIQDVRDGDQFTVLYEEIWRDGVKLRNGEIVAAEFVNQGKTYRAARYRDPNGRSNYYTPDGHSLRKAFIRAPLNFTRISSNFDPSRRHPILNTIRAHQGVDYAAPVGTPIRAAGDGKVVFRGVQGGYGNVIILQHGGNITTLYGHMSRFANARVGGRVAARRRHRLRRQVRSRDRSAPALRISGERRASKSANGLAAAGRSGAAPIPRRLQRRPRLRSGGSSTSIPTARRRWQPTERRRRSVVSREPRPYRPDQ